MSAVLTLSAWLENAFASTLTASQPSWLQAFRAQQFEKFLQRGLPTKREEWWKYTNVAYLEKTNFALAADSETSELEKYSDSTILLVFKNGRFLQEMSDLQLLPPDVILLPLSSALQTHEELIKPYLLQEPDEQRHPFTVLNGAFIGEGSFLYIPENCVVPYPIHLLFLNAQQNEFISAPRNIIVAKDNSHVKMIEEHRGNQAKNYFTNAVTELYAQANARLDYYKLQNEHDTATHIAHINVQQQQDSHVNAFFVDVGSRLAREDLTVHLHERHATCHMLGLYVLEQDEQHLDHHIYVDHKASHCTSSMLYKGVLDKKSQAVFNGKVYAHSGAKQTKAQQSNHNLLLSAAAEVNTKPELEIYEEDVKCVHGATIGQLDADALFYLRARGIEKEEALKILTQAFVEEIMDKITDPFMKDYIQQRTGHYARV